MIGLDTTAIIDIFKKEPGIKKVLESLDDVVSTTIVNYQEIMFGLNLKDLRHKEEAEYYDDFFLELVIFSDSISSAKKAAEIFWKLKNKNIDVGKFDCMIAAIFLSNGVNKIVTKNVKHFSKVPGVEVISY